MASAASSNRWASRAAGSRHVRQDGRPGRGVVGPERPVGREYESHETVIRPSRRDNKPRRGLLRRLKRSINGTHHHVSETHLPRYQAEFDYRHTTRKLNDSGRTKNLLGRVEGKRLSYKPLRDS